MPSNHPKSLMKNPNLPLFSTLVLCFCAAAPLVIASESADVEKYRADSAEKWKKAMAEFEEQNQTEKHPADSILFVGSSSIRIWENISSDMAPYHPIQRGFGGSRWSDVAVHADRIISPHRFRAVVFFVGNDITGKDDDKTPGEVAGLFAHVLGKVREHNPAAPVFYIAVTPTPKRWDVWPRIKAANSAARAVCKSKPDTYFIGTESIFIDGEGQPRPELFKDDQLHLNHDGYVRWTAAIKAHLDTVLDGAK